MHRIVEFAKEQLGIKLHPGQAAVLSDYYESGKGNWLLLSGRRGGKSLLSDVIACYEAVVPNLDQYKRANEDRYILLVSVREDSAKLHIKQIAKLLRHTKALGAMITAVKEDRIELNNGVVILSLPASARAARGYTASALVMDEAAFFVDTLGNSSAEAIFNALAPTVATFGDAARIVITTSVNTKSGLVYELYERSQNDGDLDDWHVTKTATRELNPKVSEKIIDNAMRRDPESAQAEYYSEFREQLEAFLSSDAIDRVVDPGLKQANTGGSNDYLMSVDPALLRDNYGYAIAHKDQGLIILDYIYRLKAPVNANEAEDLLKSLVDRFKPGAVLCDNPSTVQRLKDSLPMQYTPFTRQQKLRIYGSLKEAINLGMIAIPPDDDLIAELKALQIRGGVDISAPKSGMVKHDDLADCLALLVDAFNGGDYSGAVRTMPNVFYAPEYIGKDINNDFLYYPGGGFKLSPGKNIKPHPPGVTVENCRYRNKGCEACIAELEASGYYKQQEQQAELIRQAGTPDYKLMAELQRQLDQQSELGVKQHEHIQQFFKAAARRLEKFSKRD